MKVKLLNKSKFEAPKYAHEGDAGIDLKADFSKVSTITLKVKGDFTAINNPDSAINEGENPIKVLKIYPNTRVLIPTNLHVQLPKGTQLEIRPRSGWALKEGITVLNSPGTVDFNYTGNIGVILINHGYEPVSIEHGDRIAQAVLMPYHSIEWEEVDSLEDTDRGMTGFGDSGKK